MDEAADELDELIAELQRQNRAEETCVCGHPRGLHVDDEATCLARLADRTYCPCSLFRGSTGTVTSA